MERGRLFYLSGCIDHVLQEAQGIGINLCIVSRCTFISISKKYFQV